MSAGYWAALTVALMLALAILAGCATIPTGCPDGTARTEWCGCESPAYGTDC